MWDIKRLETLITPTVVGMGYEIVRVMVTGTQRPTLQIMIERVDRNGMTVEDCAAVSRAVSVVLDTIDPMGRAYTLEVSSPGVDRPLTRPEHYARFVGHEAKVDSATPILGRKRFRGRIMSAGEDSVSLATDTGEVTLAYANILKAKLVVTPELMAVGADSDA